MVYRALLAAVAAVSVIAVVVGSAHARGVDTSYPGTATERKDSAVTKAKALPPSLLAGDWDDLRPAILEACGLWDNAFVRPGAGNTGHCFNDFNHVDCCTMLEHVAHNENEGRVAGIAYSNQLGPGIRKASLTEAGEGGSWCTCELGSGDSPPNDVCHTQFGARIGFKLVWCPAGHYRTFTLVDDDGEELARGTPSGDLPSLRERQMNFQVVEGSKFARACGALEGAGAGGAGAGRGDYF